MTTEELVDELVQRFNGWNRSGDHGVLRYLNSAHEILRTVESQQTLVFDETTGKLPSLNTTAGTFKYTFADTIWRIGAIVIETGNVTDLNTTLYDYGLERLGGRTSYKNSLVIGGIQYTKVPFIRSKDRIGPSTPAQVLFTKDPQTKTDFYLSVGYKTPTQILSENIQSDIPSPFDFNYLIPAAAKLIEGVQNGNYDEARSFVNLDIKVKLWKEMDAGDQGDLDMEPVNRGF